MKILSVKNEKNIGIFEVEVDAKEWAKAFNNKKNNLAKNMNMPGFRKGHVPAAIINEKLPDNMVAYEVIRDNAWANTLISQVMADKKFTDGDYIDSVIKFDPKKIDGNKAPIMLIGFEMIPEVLDFSAKDVKNIEIPPFKANKVPAEFIDYQAKGWIRQDAMVAVKDGAIAKGDIAVINFKGYVDGKPFAGGEGKNYELEIGSKSFVDTFEDQLIGLKKGDKKDVNVKFPEKYQKDLAGKAAKFEVEVKEVKTIEYPEINKEYLSSKGIEGSTMADLKKHIEGIFTQQDEMRYTESSMAIINQEIGKKAKLSYYPVGLVDSQKRAVLQQYEQEAKRFGKQNVLDYAKTLGLNEAKFNELVELNAKNSLAITMALEKLINEYKIEANDEDRKQQLKIITRYFGSKEKAEEYMKSPNGKEYVDSLILREKLFKKIIAEAKKVEPKKEEPKKAEAKEEKKPAEKKQAANKAPAKKTK